jgi:Sec-independent protein translocase protein TatA
MLVVGVAALLFFGPDQLPKVARRAGQVVRDVQATSASFIREMERAADEPDHRPPYVAPAPYAEGPPTVTLDYEAPTATDHAAPIIPDTPSSPIQPRSQLDEVYAPLDQPQAPLEQAHITIPQTENGPAEAKPPDPTRTAPKPPEPPAPI